MPNNSLAVEVSARTFTCVVVVPSTGDMFDSSTAPGVGTIEVCTVCAACGVNVVGKVAVTKSGVAVDTFFPPQPEQSIVIAMNKEIFFRCTSLLYPRIKPYE